MYNPTSRRPYCPPGYADREDSHGNVILGDWRADKVTGALQSINRVGSNTFSKSAAEVRDSVMNFLTSSEGSISWQYSHIRSCDAKRQQ